MHAELLRDYFCGDATAAELARDLRDAFETRPDGTRRLRLANLEGEFVVTAEHLVELVDAVLRGALSADALPAVGAALTASRQFLWDERTTDGARVGAAVRAWVGPNMNGDLTRAGILRCREQLRARDR